ncbi:hypothetical protein TREMEDRAFT_63260 [Tremella mesenterica DSM 1558]|uniref:uncharacterized protein n=1 Tax=Tremella mesenterica (strain ATCC 24925 / CBS 8224 / DSM 1558 / NBRC 9311 / NRRL Y-6157 / RJB 2259-6 / UBC 559-6) TaxID=578456 RepID=UPI0003F4A2E6|nr:uncharacterized protein TREMEDRAFT_63260 [Tremella mesenterica DSM 1558]EIW68797.1 hypothetical protein TREMEDRAFT_63260 [Tremella mesenterica DSM 1558]
MYVESLGMIRAKMLWPCLDPSGAAWFSGQVQEGGFEPCSSGGARLRPCPQQQLTESKTHREPPKIQSKMTPRGPRCDSNRKKAQIQRSCHGFILNYYAQSEIESELHDGSPGEMEGRLRRGKGEGRGEMRRGKLDIHFRQSKLHVHTSQVCGHGLLRFKILVNLRMDVMGIFIRRPPISTERVVRLSEQRRLFRPAVREHKMGGDYVFRVDLTFWGK